MKPVPIGETPLHVRLQQLRERLGLNQSQMAERLGLTREWLSKLESGKRKIQELTVIKMEQLEKSLHGSAGELTSQKPSPTQNAGFKVEEPPATYDLADIERAELALLASPDTLRFLLQGELGLILDQIGHDPGAMKALLRQLRELRNRVAHGQPVTLGEAAKIDPALRAGIEARMNAIRPDPNAGRPSPAQKTPTASPGKAGAQGR